VIGRGPFVAAVIFAFALVSASAQQPEPREPASDDQRFRFRTGVELINVTATVTDANGRFVPGLTRDDFRVFEDGVEQPITHFDAERVPVSLGIVLDTSGSMAGEKIESARRALDRFVFDLLGPDDEMFLYRFDNVPRLLEDWTSDRRRISAHLRGIHPRGGTSMYDAVAEAIPLAQSGRHRKRALVVISDGNDTNSEISVAELKRAIRESEALVYAVGIDSTGAVVTQPGRPVPPRAPRGPLPFPFPIPGRRPGAPPRMPPQPYPPGGGTVIRSGPDERVNVAALRDLTDDSGGRTEIIRYARDLDPATAGIADELSRQYYLGYPATGKKDGRWHTIDVEVRNAKYRVRARRGYTAGAS
jgi:VWFA-related protein